MSSASCSDGLFHPPVLIFIWVPYIYCSSYRPPLSFTNIKKNSVLSSSLGRWWCVRVLALLNAQCEMDLEGFLDNK